MQDNNISRFTIDMAERTMIGSLIAVIVEQIKLLQKPWQQLSQHQQQEYLDRIDKQVAAAAQEAVQILVARDGVMIAAVVDKVTFKGGVQAVLDMGKKADGRHDLADAEGEEVFILIMDNTALKSRDGKPEAEKQQRDMDLGTGNLGTDFPIVDEGGGGAAAAIGGEKYHSVADMPREEYDALVKRASEHCIEHQVASIHFLSSQLGISDEVASELLAVLATAGVVSKPNHEGLRTVLISDANMLEHKPEVQGHRKCVCIMDDDEADGSLDPLGEGLQECPGFEHLDDVTNDCKHCSHDKACHEIETPAPTAETLRVCSCLLNNNETGEHVNGATETLQLCPGYEAGFGSDDCKHCTHDEICHKQEPVPDAADAIIHSDSDAGEATGSNLDPVQETVQEDQGAGDALLGAAVDLVIKYQKVSIAFLQNSLKVGYNRAARLVEALEVTGVISAANDTGKRTVKMGGPV